MTTLAAGLALLLHAAQLLGLAPLLAGAIAVLRARLLGGAGPPLLMPYHDLRRAWRKQAVRTEGATFWSHAAPPTVLGATAAAALLVPSFTLGMATAPLSDLLTVLGLLGLARAALLLGALDAGTTRGGQAAARAALYWALAVPAAVAIGYALALLTGSTNLDRALTVLRDGPLGPRLPAAVALGLVVAALGLVAAVLGGRRENRSALAGEDALRLEYSGADLGLLTYADSLQRLVWLTLIGALALPLPSTGGGRLTAWSIGVLAWAAKTSVLGFALAVWQTAAARPQVARIPALLGGAAVLASLSVLLLFAAQSAP
jgi:formate hydrogenlyase subunit 4